MTCKFLIATAACLAATLASAQSNVAVYGIMDAGIETLSNQASGKKTFMAGAGAGPAPTIWGFRGSEDLGGGLSATFNLEGGLDIARGSIRNSNGGLFGRQANLGLTGKMGSVKLGLQLDPAFISAVQTDPRGAAQSFSMLPLWIGTNVASGANSTQSVANIFESSAISYSYSAAGFSGTLLYTFGGGRGSANNIISAGASYKDGPVFVSAGAYRNKTAAGDSGPAAWNAGVSYAVSDALTLKAHHVNVEAKSGANAHFATSGIGAICASGPMSYNVAYYLSKDKANGGDAKFITAGLDYSLSKRTGIYAQMVSANQSGIGYAGAGLLDVNGGAFAAGKTVNGLAAGLRHFF